MVIDSDSTRLNSYINSMISIIFVETYICCFIALMAHAEHLNINTETSIYNVIFLTIHKIIFNAAANWDYSVTIQLIMIILALSLIVISYRNMISVYKCMKKYLINQHIDDFPFLRVKTFTDKIEGTVVDAFDGELITLNDKGLQRTISWNRIEYIEIIDEKNEQKDMQGYA